VTKWVSVTVDGDTVHEPTETFSLKLSSPVGLVIGDSSGTATIADEEGPLYAYVDDVTTPEGNSGSSNATFTVSLSQTPSPGQSVSLNVSSAAGTATSGTDFTALPSTRLTFTNATGPMQTVDVAVLGGTTPEPSETYFLKLAGATEGLVIADTSGTGTILDDD
jgi:hypothetical protein